MARGLIIAILVVAVLSLSGCWDQRIIDELAMIFALGIDVDSEDPELLLVTITNPTFSDTATVETSKTTVAAPDIHQFLINAQLQRQQLLVMGKVNVLVFSEEAARTGKLHDVMIDLDQLRDMNPDAWLCIVRGDDAQAVINLEPPQEARVAIMLSNMLQRNYVEGQVPKSNAHKYWVQHATLGINPVVPVVEITEGDELVIRGLAALDNQGKMVGMTTDRDINTFLLLTNQTMRNRFTSQVDYQDQKDRRVTGIIKKSQRSIDTRIEAGRPVIDIKLVLKLDIISIDMSLEDILTEEIFTTLQTDLARDFQGQALKFLDQTQEWGTDIIGLGQDVRAQNHRWFAQQDWSEEYGKCEINVEVRVNIKRIGTLTNPRY